MSDKEKKREEKIESWLKAFKLRHINPSNGMKSAKRLLKVKNSLDLKTLKEIKTYLNIKCKCETRILMLKGCQCGGL